MEKFGKVIVKLRIPILILSFLLLIPSAIGYFNTRVNYDILYYLPNEIETIQGQDILMDDFNKVHTRWSLSRIWIPSLLTDLLRR